METASFISTQIAADTANSTGTASRAPVASLEIPIREQELRPSAPESSEARPAGHSLQCVLFRPAGAYLPGEQSEHGVDALLS